MNLDTSGYVANQVYDRINYGGLGAGASQAVNPIFDNMATFHTNKNINDGFEKVDEKGERRADKIDEKVCDSTLAAQRGFQNVNETTSARFFALSEKLSECCCNQRVAYTELKGEIALSSANSKAYTDGQTAALKEFMMAAEIRKADKAEIIACNENAFLRRGLHDVSGSCKTGSGGCAG